MILYERLYIYWRPRGSNTENHSKLHIDQGRYTKFLITTEYSKDFRGLLSFLEKPLYCLSVLKDYLKYSPIERFTEEVEKCCDEEKVLLIPTLSIGNESMPIASVGKSMAEMVRKGVSIEKAVLYHKDEPSGFVDHDFVESMTLFISNGTTQANRNKLSSAYDLAKALWRARNKIEVLSYTQYVKKLEQQSGRTTKVIGGTNGK